MAAIASLAARIGTLLRRPRFPFVAGAVAIVLASPSLFSGFIVDDYWHRAMFLRPDAVAPYLENPLDMFVFVDGNPAKTRALMDIGILPWWTLQDLRLAFLRPITAVTHMLDYALWPNLPSAMHAHSLLWFFAVVVMAGLLFRTVHGTGLVAGLATLLYAIDDVHAMPAGWLANRNGLIALFFGVAVLLLHIQWRRDGRRWCAPLAMVALALGLLSNEGALAACGYLFAYAMFLDPGASRLARLATLAPYGLVVIVWRLVYTANGYGAHGSATYIDPAGNPFRYLEAALMRGPVLMLGQWAGIPSDLFVFLPHPAQLVVCGLGIAVIVVVAHFLWPIVRADKTARFWALGMLLAVAPVCATFPMDRLLLFSGLGAMALLAALLVHLYEQRPFLAPRVKWFAIALVVIHVVLAPLMLPTRIIAFAAAGAVLSDSASDELSSESIAGKTMVVVNAPNLGFTSYFPVLRALQGAPLPDTIRGLAPNMGLPMPVYLRRTDAQTLEVWTSNGFQWILMRDSDHPFAVGDTVELPGMRVAVLSLAPEGWPKAVSYRFDVPLEHHALAWYQVTDWQYEPFTPPAIGEEIVLRP